MLSALGTMPNNTYTVQLAQSDVSVLTTLCLYSIFTSIILEHALCKARLLLALLLTC